MQMGPYNLMEAVGRGGTGTVYRGQHRRSGAIVAVKVMAAELTADPVLLKRFEQEFAAACRLDHPHIVRGLDFGLEKGVPYLVMEFVDGQNLGQRIREQGPLGVDHALRILLQVSDALRLAHAHQLIHRDVKPENILLAADGHARLTDLGLMKDLGAGADLTRSRACLGTVTFMAPEQFEDARHADFRCDLYGLASTLYFALTGLAPFRGRGNLAILRKKLDNDFVPPGQLVPGVPPGLDRVICAALDVSPARRPASCDEWMAALHAAVQVLAATSTDAEAPPAADAAPEPRNRRGARRYPSTIGASCRRVQGRPDPWQTDVQDISLTGLRMELDRRFEAGTVLTLEIQNERGGGAARLLAQVRWVREAMDRKWSIGCSFHRSLTDAELETLLECKTATVMLQGDARTR
jgi:eukaryotic-like serine/threonine-protein kinase